MGRLLWPGSVGESEHVPYIKTRRLCRVHDPGVNLPAERCPPEGVHDGLPVTPAAADPEWSSGTCQRSSPATQRIESTGDDLRPHPAIQRSGHRLLAASTPRNDLVTESDGRVAMPVAQPLPYGLSSGHPDCPLHLERSLGGGCGRCARRHLRPRLLLGLWLHHHHRARGVAAHIGRCPTQQHIQEAPFTVGANDEEVHS